MDCSLLGFPVPHYLPDFSQTHACWVSDANNNKNNPYKIKDASAEKVKGSQVLTLEKWQSRSSEDYSTSLTGWYLYFFCTSK